MEGVLTDQNRVQLLQVYSCTRFSTQTLQLQRGGEEGGRVGQGADVQNLQRRVVLHLEGGEPAERVGADREQLDGGARAYVEGALLEGERLGADLHATQSAQSDEAQLVHGGEGVAADGERVEQTRGGDGELAEAGEGAVAEGQIGQRRAVGDG